MDVKTLTGLYPWMDTMMAESLVKTHENGSLAKLVEQEHNPARELEGAGGTITGAITVENKIEAHMSSTEDECEEASQSSSSSTRV